MNEMRKGEVKQIMAENIRWKIRSVIEEWEGKQEIKINEKKPWWRKTNVNERKRYENKKVGTIKNRIKRQSNSHEIYS